MATHDYVIDNQSAPALRADLNNALQAIVTQNSSATAPTTTYANMFWYDTTNNQLKKRNEANSAWVTLGTIDEALGIFTPSGGPVIATQAEAEAGTDNTKMVTPLRVKNALNASGSAPTYACRAWVNFNGTGTVAIRAAGNVTSITDNGVGNYTVNFATNMVDTNYAAVGAGEANRNATSLQALAVNYVTFNTLSGGSSTTNIDSDTLCIAVFR